MNSVCRLFNFSYNNTINNRLYNALRQSNIKITKKDFDTINDNDINYIVNYFVQKQYTNVNDQELIIKKINYKLYHLEFNYNINNINPRLITKYNNDLKNLLKSKE